MVARGLRFQQAIRQVRAASWGYFLEHDVPTVDVDGQLHTDSNPFAKQLAKCLLLSHDLAPLEWFFPVWNPFDYSWHMPLTSNAGVVSVSSIEL